MPRYKVTLELEEREQLEQLTRKGKIAAAKLIHARTLLLCDQGEHNSEPLGGRRHIEITGSRTAKDWAKFVQQMLDERHTDAKKVILVPDNLNTYKIASLYEAFPPEKAKSNH